MKINCWLTNRDLLSPVRGMVEQLSRMQAVGRIVIIDCDSTYEPLLAWYESQTVAEVLRRGNLHNHAAWRCGEELAGNSPFYFTSDADLDLTGIPDDMLLRMAEQLDADPGLVKAGLSLRIDDLPDGCPLAKAAREHEAKYWTNDKGPGYLADIDTTAAVYRAGKGWGGYGPSMRLKPPYVARHLLWYVTDPGDEWSHYLARLSPTGLGWSPRMRTLAGKQPA